MQQNMDINLEIAAENYIECLIDRGDLVYIGGYTFELSDAATLEAAHFAEAVRRV